MSVLFNHPAESQENQQVGGILRMYSCYTWVDVYPGQKTRSYISVSR
jgi:hypothetical protein